MESERFFGRVREPDERDRAYAMGALLPAAWPKATRRMWTIGPVLDQGHHNSCVGHGVKGWLMSTPVRSGPMEPPSALDIYNLARTLDDDPTNDNRDTGTSVRAGFAAVAQSGHVKSYIWSWDVDTTVRWLLTHGSVVIGTDWLTGMEDTDPAGYIHVAGTVLGGHCTLLYGVDRRTETLYGVNSWGVGWGQAGKFKLTFSDFGLLLAHGGDCCCGVEQFVKPAAA